MKTKSFFANFLMMATLVACNSTTPKQDSTVEKTDSAKETATSNNPASVEKVVFEVVSTLQKENIKGKVKKIDFFERRKNRINPYIGGVFDCEFNL